MWLMHYLTIIVSWFHPEVWLSEILRDKCSSLWSPTILILELEAEVNSHDRVPTLNRPKCLPSAMQIPAQSST